MRRHYLGSADSPRVATQSQIYFSQVLQAYLDKLRLERTKTPANATNLAGWFLGPKAENTELLKQFILQAIDNHVQSRLDYHPEDPIWITEEIKQSESYKLTTAHFQEVFQELLNELQGSVPYWSYRWQSHMAWDLSLPGIVGYFAAMLYNSNNVAAEASPVTTPLEIIVGDDLCIMLGYQIPDPDDPTGIRPWGHITADGTIANMESMWAARNAKYYGITVAEAIRNEPGLSAAKSITIPLPTGERGVLLDLDTWQLLNLMSDDVLALPERLTSEYGISTGVVNQSLNPYTLQVLGLQTFTHRYLSRLENLPILLGSSTVHYSWPKGAALTGLGEGLLHYIHVNENAHMELDSLRSKLDHCLANQQAIIMLIVVIGSTDESAVDPLAAIVELRESYRQRGLDFYIHADAAWGGYFASILHEAPLDYDNPPNRQFTPAMVMSEYVTAQYEALRYTDSISIDPHKAGFILYPAGGLCYRNAAMRDLIAFAAPEVYHGEIDPVVGIYGIEGSKPGAAAAAVYLSHRLIPLNRNGYGKILGKALFNSKRLYSALVTMETEDQFIVVPFQRLPAEKAGESPQKVAEQLDYIRTQIVPKTNDELLQDPEAMALFRELGSDQLIITYGFNFKVNGQLNTDVSLYNAFIQEIFNQLSLSPDHDEVLKTPMLITMSSFDPEVYGMIFMNTFKQRLGLEGQPNSSINFLVSTTMSPWLTDTSEGSFIPRLITILQETVIQSIGRV